MANQAKLADNEHVKQLMEILSESKMGAQAEEFSNIVNYVTAMENQLNNVLNELQGVKNQLAEIKDKQNPVFKACTNMVKGLEAQVNKLKERLDAVKNDIINGAKEAVTAFKEKGLSAMKKVVDFMLGSAKKELSAIKTTLQEHVKTADKAIVRIDAMSNEVHEVGAHLRNIGRAAAGKNLVSKRENGKLTAAIKAPVRALKNLSQWAEKKIDALINKLEQKQQKPSLLGKLDAHKKDLAEQKNTPAQTKSKAQEAAL